MTNPYRAMCAELVAAVDLLCGSGDSPGQPGSRLILTVHVEALDELADRARALLDQPEPETPTDEELVNFRNRATGDCCASRSNNGANLLSGDDLVACQAAGLRAVLAKWGNQ